MIVQELRRIYSLLCIFLGESKNPLDESYQLQFPCPRCVENKGEGERRKYNLEVNIAKGVFHCWSCSQHDSDMQGSIKKLIRIFGNKDIMDDYLDAVESLRNSKYFKLYIDDGNSGYSIIDEKPVLKLPDTFRKLNKNEIHSKLEKDAVKYLEQRGIGWDIIDNFNIGVTSYDSKSPLVGNRILLPSYDEFDTLNYWTGRDITNAPKRQKYFNAKAERKDLIFNENKIQWDADVTLVEGPFDHIVVPNSIPLLGKVLTKEFKIFSDIFNKAHGNINIWLDGDAFKDVKKIYGLLNHDKMYGKIRYIPTSEDLDPSLIYERYGKKGIIDHLRGAKQINEIEL